MNTLHRVSAVILALALLASACAPSVAPAPTPAPTQPPARPTAVAPAPAATPSPPSPAPTVIALATPLTRQPTPVAAQSGPKLGGTLKLWRPFDAPHYDMHQEPSLNVHAPFSPVYNKLIRFNYERINELEGDLAESWQVSPDGKVYTLKLRSGVMFHDGKEMTAEDAAYSINRVKYPAKGQVAPLGVFFAQMDKAEVVDKYTVRIRLTQPYSAFLAVLARDGVAIMPKRLIEEKGDMKRDAVGTGPFTFESHTRGVAIRFKKNPNYFRKGQPYLDGIIRYIMGDPATRFAALRTHQINMTEVANGVTVPEIEVLRKELKDQVSIGQTDLGVFTWVVLNMRKKPWDDLRVRRAVSLALDRPEAIKSIEDGSGSLWGVIGPTPWSMSQDDIMKLPGFSKDKTKEREEARRLLAEAGYPNGLSTTLHYRIPGTVYERGAVYMQQQLKTIGVDAKQLTTVSAAQYGDMRGGKIDFDMFIYRGAIILPDPDLQFQDMAAPNNQSDYTPGADLKKLMEQQLAEQDQTKRKALVQQVEKGLLSDLPAAPMYWAPYLMAYWKEVRNFRIGLTIFTYQSYPEFVWLDQ